MDLLAAYWLVGLGYVLAAVPRAIEMARVSEHLGLDELGRKQVAQSIALLLFAGVAWPALLLLKLAMAFRELVPQDWEDDDGCEDAEDDEATAPGGSRQGGVEGDGQLGRDLPLPPPGQDDGRQLGGVVRGAGAHRGQRRAAVRDDLPDMRGASRDQHGVDDAAQPPERSGQARGENA